MKKLILSLLLIGAIGAIQAQKTIDDQFHAWTVVQGNHHLNNKFDLHTEYQFRRSNGYADWQQSLLRVGLDYKLNPQLTLTAGYAWVLSFPYGTQPILNNTDESRIWEQVNLKQNFGPIQIQHRYRLEQRWIEQFAQQNGQINQLDNVFRQRFRYRAPALIPLTKKGMVNNTPFLNVNDEVFLGFGKGIGKNVLDQNRFIAAFGWRFNQDFNIQIGYLNQFVIKSDGLRMERNHTLWTSIVYNLNFNK
ncbi:MAG: hypothetical protein RL078_423 [Bacteroidota bacterium]